jgi:hypothetical protein
MSTNIQLHYIVSVEAESTHRLELPEGVRPMYYRTLILRDDEGHKTTIDLFSTAPENLRIIGGDTV